MITAIVGMLDHCFCCLLCAEEEIDLSVSFIADITILPDGHKIDYRYPENSYTLWEGKFAAY